MFESAAVVGADAAVVGVVLGSAVLHAMWNALAHAARDRFAAITLIGIACLVCATPALLVSPVPNRESWPFIAVSAALETVYSFGLALAYRLGDFSRTYPLARGTSPLLVALVATLVIGQPASGGEWLGIVVICAGLFTLAFADGLPGREGLPAVAAAVGTGTVIASYTVVDGLGVRRAGTVIGYAAWIFVLEGAAVVLIAAVLRGRALAPALRADSVRGLAGGVVSMVAYSLVLWAQTRGSLAEVATLRETSILIGCVIGTVVFRERFGRARLLASAGVVLGILLISWS
ncbi:MAG TPA: EamA family transporter [Actinocrinis sp.]|nr:EamA family transporter [Actinocrinis sp.]